jgi:hypothetical protein
MDCLTVSLLPRLEIIVTCEIEGFIKVPEAKEHDRFGELFFDLEILLADDIHSWMRDLCGKLGILSPAKIENALRSLRDDAELPWLVEVEYAKSTRRKRKNGAVKTVYVILK